MALASSLRRAAHHNLTTLRASPLAELSGSLGDLGTLLPLMLTLALHRSISLPSTLFFSGLSNILTGLVFGIPLPVQPMKAIAAAAIAAESPQPVTVAAGALVGAVIGLLSITGLLGGVVRRGWVPVPVVKGIQLGAGLQLVVSGGGSMLSKLGWVGGEQWWDGRVWALGAFVGLLLTSTPTSTTTVGKRKAGRFPYALAVFGLGLLLAGLSLVVGRGGGRGDDGTNARLFQLWRPRFAVPAFSDPAAWGMALGQLPLTTLNSVIAAAALASDAKPAANTPSVTDLGLSVAAMNLVGCWFGAMPVCHGAGGLAAQWRFGARSGSSVVMLGTVKLLLGLFLAEGTTLLRFLDRFPKAFLGVMVIAAGLELAKVGQSLNCGAADLWVDEDAGQASSTTTRKQRTLSEDERMERWTIMLMTAAGILAFKNDAVGFLAGMATWGAYGAGRAVERWREARRGHHDKDDGEDDGDDGIAEREPLLGRA
ncbi:hypothetical protein BD289DRAFT_368951 [Coniella lustricola]|uniref:Sulfate transporter n=1 Tax=Coniella lustricola TaxID=2025994 RepID=A0A2T3A7B1_9PEZI|nr:hypothetical protein BD289DRAFT_368951 [Coniella lustricola]